MKLPTTAPTWRNRGAPHALPFSLWNAQLRRLGPGKPVLLLDLDALDANLRAVREALAPGMAVRVVAKSLPSLPLLRFVMERLETRRLMVFDESISILAAAFPDADLLLGKPLPVQAAAIFLADLEHKGDLPAASRVTWLVDSAERLSQYAALARSKGVRLRVSLEVDVGLHRGGAPDPAALRPLLDAIAAEPAHLSLAGLMGYDAHVTSAPPLFSSVQGAFNATVARYAAFRQVAQDLHRSAPRPGEGLVFNGGGSKTYMLHRAGGPVNEVALGSCLVKPTDFDVPTLEAHRPALFIATPVLKRLQGTRVPFLEWLSPAWSLLDPNRELTYFVFGGGWMAKPVSPAGLTANPIFGFSTNQALLNGSEKTALHPDDWIFLRPTQSERVIQELGAIRIVYSESTTDPLPGAPAAAPTPGPALLDTWSVLPFSP